MHFCGGGIHFYSGASRLIYLSVCDCPCARVCYCAVANKDLHEILVKMSGT